MLDGMLDEQHPDYVKQRMEYLNTIKSHIKFLKFCNNYKYL